MDRIRGRTREESRFDQAVYDKVIDQCRDLSSVVRDDLIMAGNLPPGTLAIRSSDGLMRGTLDVEALDAVAMEVRVLGIAERAQDSVNP